MRRVYQWIALPIATVMITSALVIPVSAMQQTETIITISPGQVMNEINPYLFGVNHRYYDDGVGMYDSKNQQIYPDFLSSYNDIGFTSMRYPGGTVANTFVWKRSIGPQEHRGTMVHGQVLNLSPQTANFGLDEAARFCEQTNTDMSYVYNMGNGNAEDCAELVEYLNAPNDGSNWGGGTDWAAVRAENGHSDPYGINAIELGNEMYIPGQFYWLENKTNLSLEENYIFGGEVRFENQLLTLTDDWRDSAAESDGSANMVKYVRYGPIIPNTITIKVADTVWEYTEDISLASSDALVYTVDWEKGAITFGDGVHGAIPVAGSVIKASYTSKRDGFNDYYTAIKKVDPSIQVYSCFHSDKFLETMGRDYLYDGIVVHPYAQFMPPASTMQNYHDNIMIEADKKMVDVLEIRNKMRSCVAPERQEQMKIMATEYGILSNNAPENSYLYSLDHGLFVSKCLIKMMEAGVTKAHKHCLIDIAEGSTLGPGGQAVISGKPDFVLSATGQALKLFREMTGTTQVESSIANCPLHKTHDNQLLEKLNLITSVDELGNLYIIAVNVDTKDDVTATVQFDGFVPKGTAEVRTLNSESYLDFNDVNNREKVAIQTTTIDVFENFKYTFPAHSLTAIKLSGQLVETEQQIPTPIAAWDFNSQTDGVIPNLINDTSGISMEHGATLEQLEEGNSCLKLTANMDYGKSPCIVNLHDTDMTTCMWIRLDAENSAKQIILQQGGTYGTTWLYRNRNGCLASYIGGNYLISDAHIEPDVWYHVAVVKEGTTVKLYLDGKLVSYGSSIIDHSLTAEMIFGRHKTPTLTEQDWDGAIDETAIYDQALSGAQIRHIFASYN